ncbi:alpha/beta fold hydrolase [Microterricola viridarii]|uniref:Pimeloyl-ACP methyl ester carboxylesterase n=1 Tax=Microterricola viridarii TaxID=412690 RepID=A0A1H1WJS6_9MICO|nr:alpha/beta hydrolase [Microterricola viridarii]SDS96851.1 Pimeloyl-ACP methyl ester carboxylesterase [Microterricola viridarii]
MAERRSGALAAVVLGWLLVGGLAVLAGCTGAAPNDTPSASPAADAGELVDIGDGRQLFLSCRGTGKPTVLLVSGTGGAADEWMVAGDPADPSVPPTPSARSVFDTVALTTRVCAYDRPGTTLLDGEMSPSTEVAQPTTALTGVADIQRLLDASGEEGSLVLVGASWGGEIAQLFARTPPQSVAGLVLVDSASEYLHDTLSPAQWDGWMSVIAAAATPGAESPDYEGSLAQLADAAAVPALPATVLTSDQPWDLQVTPGASTWPAWLAAQDELAAAWHATHIADTQSGHGIHVQQPELVAAAITAIVDEVRAQE